MGTTMLGLKAQWVLPVAGEPLRGGVVWTEGERIVAVERGRGGRGARDLGNVALLPGLINAHTHLELSAFSEPAGWPGISLVQWLGIVVGARRLPTYDAAEAVQRGITQSCRCGVAALGEIARPGGPRAVYSRPDVGELPAPPGVDVTVFLELIGPTAERTGEALCLAERHTGAGRGNAGWRPGLCPHAPYSITPELLEGACRLSRDRSVPVAFHLAESREEMQLLRSGTGPFRQLLERLGAWDAAVQPPGRRPRDYLELLATADRALVVHGNYLAEDEIAFLGRRSERMAVVYCPRTHAWFQHDPYPLEAMLAAGITVALGTDSRASSPDLNPLEEMRAAARRNPRVPPYRILEMGTLGGAKALGLDAEFGTIEPGKRARLAVVPLPDIGSGDPYRLLLG